MKSVLIFGATGGIGREVAHLFAKEGYKIGIHYASNQNKAIELASEFDKLGVESILVKADISNEEEVKKVFEDVLEKFDKIDVVINTSGIMKLSKIKDLDMDIFDEIMRINVRGTVLVSKYALKYLNKEGSLLNFSTTVTKTQSVNYGAYVASKAAVEALTLILAREVKGENIRINTIAPGPTVTPLFTEGKTEDQINFIANLNPLERLGNPNDIAQAVLTITNSKWINGQVIFVNGGMA